MARSGSAADPVHVQNVDGSPIGGGGGGGDASAANQVTGNDSLASILAKIIVAPATEAEQAAQSALLTTIRNNGDELEIGLGHAADEASVAGGVGSLNAKQRLVTTQLAAILAAVDGLEGLATTLNGLVDTLESLIGTTNTTLTTIDGRVDGVEAKLDTLIAQQQPVLLPLDNTDIDESEDAVKVSAGRLYGYYLYNDGAAEVYVKFYDATVANVTVGTTDPVLTLGIPAGGAANLLIPGGVAFANAITVAATTGAATADTGAPAANQVVGSFLYV